MRARAAAMECGEHYDDTTVRWEVSDDRGIVTVLQDGRHVVSKEFVETDGSLERQHMVEYARILLGRARLVVIIPRERAVDLRLRMLELNRHWLFYYLLFYYDEDSLHRLDRAEWRRLRGIPPDDLRPEVA